MKAMTGAATVAQLMDVSERHVYNLVARDQLPFKHYKFGRTLRFRIPELEEFFGIELPKESETEK